MKKNILILITHGFRVRNVLYTRLWIELQKLGDITLVCPESDVIALRDDFGKVAKIEGYPILTNSKLEGRFTGIRKNVLTHPRRNTTVNVFNLNDRYKSPIKYYLRTIANSIFGRSRTLKSLWLSFERTVLPGTEFDSILERVNPDLVLTTDYASHSVEIRLMRAARRRKCPTVSIVYSWDNLSSKGIMGEIPTKLIVWNEIMAGEAMEFHQYPREDVLVTGAAQFDIYFQKHLLCSREEACKRWGLDPKRPIVAFGTISSIYFPYCLEIIELILEARSAGRVPSDLQLLVRLHPQTMFGEHRDIIVEQIVELAGKIEGLYVNVPPVKRWGVLYSPTPEDQQDLAEILLHSVALLHPGSTLSIDAAAMDCPIIGIAFDGRDELPYGKSIRRHWDFSYMQPVIESGAVDLAYNISQLEGSIRKFCSDRKVLAKERQELASLLCGFVDGRSAERIAAAVEAVQN